MACHKNCRDGEEVVRELSGVRGLFILTVNHDFDPSLCEDELQEFVSVSAESVVVHDHNLSDQSLHNCVQKGLTFEVRLLVGAAASGLDDFLFRGFLDGFTEEALDVGGVV